MNGDIAEILVYMTNITPFIRQQIEGYLTWKWGLQASLPATHPYFTAPPQQAYTTFTPTLYSGLQLWLDAQDSATVIRTGTSISQWNDKSGFTRNAVPFQGTNPTYSTTGLNSQACVQFTSGRGMRSPAAAGTYSSNVTAFVILQKTGGNNSFETLISRTGTPTTSIPSPFDLYNAIRLIGNGGPSVGTGYVQANSTNDIRNMTSPTMFGFTASIAQGFVENVNGGTVATVISPSSVYGDNASFMYVACRDEATTAFTGNIGEIIIYNQTLSTEQRQTVEGYLAWKWGIQGLLPVTHPYALINPANPTAALTVITSGLRIRFDATTYSGSGAWENTGELGTGWNATVDAGTPSKNIAGNGVVFNGSTNFTFPNISVGNAWSVSLWVKRTGTSGSSAAFVTQIFSGTTNLTVWTNGDNAPGDGVVGGYYNGAWRNGSSVTLTLNTWINVTCTWNGTSIVTYQNGIFVGSVNPGVTSVDNGLAYRIGRRWDGPMYIVGEIGQIFIYNRTITAQEVLQNYAATSSTFSV